MKKLEFDIRINAPRQKVWDVLWTDDTYRQWTSVFGEGSKAVSDWNEGSRILFLNKDDDGMYSLIEKKVPNEEMVFLHQGEVVKGVKKSGDTDKGWPESRESYFLEEDGAATKLRVELETPEDYAEYFGKTFPRSLVIVKELAEA